MMAILNMGDDDAELFNPADSANGIYVVDEYHSLIPLLLQLNSSHNNYPISTPKINDYGHKNNKVIETINLKDWDFRISNN